MPELTEEKIYSEGPHYFDDLIADIAQAKSSIDIEIYAFRMDTLGQKICDALLSAAKQGSTFVFWSMGPAVLAGMAPVCKT